MALNEVHKYGAWLTIPVPDTLTVGSAYMFGGDTPCVIQAIYEPDRPAIDGYVALPTSTGGNEDGSQVDSDLMPADSVFASVAFWGVWAFELDGDHEIGTEVAAQADGTIALGTGFGRITNRGLDGRYHVRLAS